MLIVAKKIWSSVKPVWKSMPKVRKSTFKQFFLMLSQCFWRAYWNDTFTICLKVGLGRLSVGGFLTLLYNTNAKCQQSLCSNDFFLQLTQQASLYDFRKIYICHFYCIFPATVIWFVYLLKILRMCRWYIFSSQKSRMIIAGESARDNGLKF